jgi:hypothetical protein
VKRVALYLRVSTTEQSPESQLQDLRGLADSGKVDVRLARHSVLTFCLSTCRYCTSELVNGLQQTI